MRKPEDSDRVTVSDGMIRDTLSEKLIFAEPRRREQIPGAGRWNGKTWRWA